MSDLAAVVLAAGLGTRLRSATPKHLHPLLGRRMVDWVLDAVRPLGADPLVVVVSEETAAAFDGETTALQPSPRGTGDAAASAREALRGLRGRRPDRAGRYAARLDRAALGLSSRRTGASGRR